MSIGGTNNGFPKHPADRRTSWRTSATGISSILTSIAALLQAWSNDTLTPEIVSAALPGIIAGIGLICARDNSVSSEDAGAR